LFAGRQINHQEPQMTIHTITAKIEIEVTATESRPNTLAGVLDEFGGPALWDAILESLRKHAKSKPEFMVHLAAFQRMDLNAPLAAAAR